MSDIVIRISGNIDDFDKALDDISGKTEGLEEKLSTIAKTSAIAFAALTAEVGFSVKAFASQEEASNRLTQALANQGIYSKALFENYRSQADALQTLTGIDDDAIVSGQALLQGYMGETKITKELTKAVVDLSVAKGIDLQSAFEAVGKSIGTSTNALAKQGIEIDASASKQEKLAAVITGINSKYHDQAEAAAQGIGSLKLLHNTFGDLQEEIGSRFAPAITVGIQKLTHFIGTIKENKPLVDLIASLTVAGIVVSGLGVVVAGGAIAFLQLRAALAAAQIATSAMSLAVKGLVGATGLGLIVVLATELYLNWSSIWPRMQAAFQAFVDNIGTLGQGLANILKGVFTFDGELIKQGLEQAKSAFLEGYEDYKALTLEQKQIAHEEELAANEQREAELNAQRTIASQAELTEAQLVAQKMKELRDQADNQRITDKAKANLLYLESQKKFGTLYADIEKVTNEVINEDRKKALSDMATMQRSSNSTLKEIGKAAAVANILIATKESMMNIYKGFSTIPLVGQALGIAGAAAAAAFGAEQISQVMGAAQGGLISGGIPGVDSVPLLAQAGELVAPRSNFEEVIGSVRAQREAEKQAERGLVPSFGGGQGGGVATVVLELRDDLVQFIEAKMIERQNLNISLQGA